jgi:hypothetical protein
VGARLHRLRRCILLLLRLHLWNLLLLNLLDLLLRLLLGQLLGRSLLLFTAPKHRRMDGVLELDSLTLCTLVVRWARRISARSAGAAASQNEGTDHRRGPRRVVPAQRKRNAVLTFSGYEPRLWRIIERRKAGWQADAAAKSCLHEW